MIARLEGAALTTARAMQEISQHWDAVYEAMRRAEQPGDDQSPGLGRAEQRGTGSPLRGTGPLHAYRQIHGPVVELPRSLQPPLTRLWQKPTRNSLGIPRGGGAGSLDHPERLGGVCGNVVASRFGHG